MKLLVVDDELSMRELLEIVFQGEGFEVQTAEGLADAKSLLGSSLQDLVICDMNLQDGNGLDLLRHVGQHHPETAFVLITAYASADSAIDALKSGAFDYITKPFDVEELKTIVRHALESSSKNRQQGERSDGSRPEKNRLIGVSPAMIRIYKTVGVVAPTDSTILLTGESGTGKEMIARVIHEISPRKESPFVSINCGSFPETLLESELFGYMKGAFTGAVNNKKGLFEEAHRGTLFLDEIAETTPAMQVKLLRAIQDRRIRRLGSTEENQVDVRLVAATNKDLVQRIDQGLFREDLYYRIAVIPIHLPPLRERKEDIPELANYFLGRFSRRNKKKIDGFEPEAMNRLLSHEWKGNVRELENVVERAVALETGDKIQEARLPDDLLNPRVGPSSQAVHGVEIPDDGFDLDPYMESVERAVILKALEKAGGVQIRASRLLKITYRSLLHRIHKLRIVF